MDELEQSDRPVVPTKLANNAGGPAAESVEERGLAKRNPGQDDTYRILGRGSVNSGLERIRQAAQKDKEVEFTSLYHQVYSMDMLWEAYRSLKREAAPGVDGETWQHYGEDVEGNLHDLSGRLRRGAYRAQPVKRVFIPKADGRQRPLGLPVLEDKIVQRATVMVLNAIYETDFLGFSYGFRGRRSQHDALAALDQGLMTKKVNWVLDADIRGFFDAIDREWLVKFVEHRIGDRRVVRLIQKWLRAGVLENGAWTQQEEGTPQGSSISPLLANIYLHYVFDQWVQQWRQRQAKGDVVVVRYADDFIVGFQYQSEAEQFLAALRARMKKFGLELHPEKTRLVEFGRYAARDRQQCGLGKPETFTFLGFTHLCGQTRNGKFTVKRQTIGQRLRAKLKEVKAELRVRLHDPVATVGAWLASVVNGHFRYYGVPWNWRALVRFRDSIERMWQRALRRRSQKARLNWTRMRRVLKRWLPPVHIYHPHFSARFAVMTQGKSPVR
ncbi:MAG: group II intron reverse transcriptase/maturase [Chloroflexota bacterium]